LKELSSPIPNVKLIYVTPEKIAKSKRFMAQVSNCAINLIVHYACTKS